MCHVFPRPRSRSPSASRSYVVVADSTTAFCTNRLASIPSDYLVRPSQTCSSAIMLHPAPRPLAHPCMSQTLCVCMILMTRLSARLRILSTCSKPSQQTDPEKTSFFHVTVCFCFSVYPVAENRSNLIQPKLLLYTHVILVASFFFQTKLIRCLRYFVCSFRDSASSNPQPYTRQSSSATDPGLPAHTCATAWALVCTRASP